MKCPHCGNEINIGQLLGSQTSRHKAIAARRNAKLGGWPKGKKRGKRKGKKRGKRKPDVNITAHSIVAQAEKLTQQAQPPGLPKAE